MSDPALQTAPIELQGSDVALFASDIHLSEAEPATLALFLSALRSHAPGSTHLFLLGDVFEAWIGDDGPDAAALELQAVLAALAGAGTQIFLMRGNRDFLLDVPVADAAAGARTISFSTLSGARMLVDPCLVGLFGEVVLLTHGDALCIDDAQYQAFRAQVRSAAWQQAFLAKPLAERQAIARNMREQSNTLKQAKPDYLMDVNAGAVADLLREQGVLTLLHGHTHRPATHTLSIDGTPALRWVLPDWDAHAARGGFVRVDRSGWHRIAVSAG